MKFETDQKDDEKMFHGVEALADRRRAWFRDARQTDAMDRVALSSSPCLAYFDVISLVADGLLNGNRGKSILFQRLYPPCGLIGKNAFSSLDLNERKTLLIILMTLLKHHKHCICDPLFD